MALDDKGHRSSSLKQSNKKHKHGGHQSKRAIDKANKGKENIKTIMNSK